jgi:phosphoribosylaminoimidazole-succinocarboxamide synthase
MRRCENMGSVKDLQILKKPEEKKIGFGRFTFSDRYSVFDWGEMPDQITHKGAAITLLGGYFFELLEQKGIPTHYRGLVEDGIAKKIADLRKPTNTMEINLLQVKKPLLEGNQYNYSMYQQKNGGFLIPLEVIYRNSLPSGSSVFKRLNSGEITPQDLGLKKMPVPNQRLDPPLLDVSTKLEITDRYLTWSEAKQISGLTDVEIDELKKITNTVNNLITKEFTRIGLVNEDGKIEVGFNAKRHIMIVDVLGTLDECRFTFEGLPVSKEIARIYYRNTAWYQAVEEAKKKDRPHWKTICKMQPEPLPPRLKLLISQIYCACTNEITKKEWFRDIPRLKMILQEIKEILLERNITL